MGFGLVRVSNEANVTVTHWRRWAVCSSQGSALFKRRETDTFHIPGGAHHHTHIQCAHTCVKLKLSGPYIWLRMLLLLIKVFSWRRISENTFSCFDGQLVTRVTATRCMYVYCRGCQQIHMGGVCVCVYIYVSIFIRSVEANPIMIVSFQIKQIDLWWLQMQERKWKEAKRRRGISSAEINTALPTSPDYST